VGVKQRRAEVGAAPAVVRPVGGGPPVDWATLTVEGDELVLRLHGWRRVVGVSRGTRVPLASVTAVRHDSSPHSSVPTKLRVRARGRSRLWRLGAYHGGAGWTYWACGRGRSAVVIETSGTRYRFVVVEAADPLRVIATVRAAVGLSPDGTVSPDRSRLPPSGESGAS
jgi:hypothetical protein